MQVPSEISLDNMNIDDLSVNTIRTQAMDAVQKADFGHPGTPMALAPLAYILSKEKSDTPQMIFFEIKPRNDGCVLFFRQEYAKELSDEEYGRYNFNWGYYVVKDLQDACDILWPVYDQSDGVDGFVSLEVSPYLAHDVHGTMEEVRRLFNAVNRPNAFIKIPGTAAGVPAIEQMLYEGVNINITLLFSIQSYEAVAQAYIRALERRVIRIHLGKDVERGLKQIKESLS